MIAEKIKLLTFKSKAEFDKKAEEIIGLQYQIDVLKAELNQKTEAVKLEYSAKIEPLKIEKQNIVTLVYGWVLANAAMLFGKKKSARCATGSYGLKKSGKTLKLLDEDAKEEDIAKILFDADKKQYVKVVYKLDKNAIKTALSEETDVELLDKYFEKLQDLEFFVKPDKDGDKAEEK